MLFIVGISGISMLGGSIWMGNPEVRSHFGRWVCSYASSGCSNLGVHCPQRELLLGQVLKRRKSHQPFPFTIKIAKKTYHSHIPKPWACSHGVLQVALLDPENVLELTLNARPMSTDLSPASIRPDITRKPHFLLNVIARVGKLESSPVVFKKSDTSWKCKMFTVLTQITVVLFQRPRCSSYRGGSVFHCVGPKPKALKSTYWSDSPLWCRSYYLSWSQPTTSEVTRMQHHDHPANLKPPLVYAHSSASELFLEKICWPVEASLEQQSAPRGTSQQSLLTSSLQKISSLIYWCLGYFGDVFFSVCRLL